MCQDRCKNWRNPAVFVWSLEFHRKIECGHCYLRICIAKCVQIKKQRVLCRTVNINHVVLLRPTVKYPYEELFRPWLYDELNAFYLLIPLKLYQKKCVLLYATKFLRYNLTCAIKQFNYRQKKYAKQSQQKHFNSSLAFSRSHPMLHSFKCPNTYTFFKSSCIFYTQNNKNSCDSLKFVGCMWNYDYQRMYESEWNKCTSVCCDDSVSYAPSWDSVNSCQETIYAGQKCREIFGIVALSAPIIVICSFAIIGLFKDDIQKCRRRRQQLNLMSQIEQRGQVVPSPLEMGLLIERNLPELAPSENRLDLEWIEEPEKNSKVGEFCRVCAKTGVSLELHCGHSYHRQCIAQSLSRIKEFLICRSANVNHIKVYCEDCLRCCFNTTLAVFLHQQPAGKSMRCFKCRRENTVRIQAIQV